MTSSSFYFFGVLADCLFWKCKYIISLIANKLPLLLQRIKM